MHSAMQRRVFYKGARVRLAGEGVGMSYTDRHGTRTGNWGDLEKSFIVVKTDSV